MCHSTPAFDSGYIWHRSEATSFPLPYLGGVCVRRVHPRQYDYQEYPRLSLLFVRAFSPLVQHPSLRNLVLPPYVAVTVHLLTIQVPPNPDIDSNLGTVDSSTKTFSSFNCQLSVCHQHPSLYAFTFPHIKKNATTRFSPNPGKPFPRVCSSRYLRSSFPGVIHSSD